MQWVLSPIINLATPRNLIHVAVYMQLCNELHCRRKTSCNERSSCHSRENSDVQWTYGTCSHKRLYCGLHNAQFPRTSIGESGESKWQCNRYYFIIRCPCNHCLFTLLDILQTVKFHWICQHRNTSITQSNRRVYAFFLALLCKTLRAVHESVKDHFSSGCCIWCPVLYSFEEK